MPYAYLEKNYWHVVLFDHNLCQPDTIRRQDVGRPGHSIRQACVKDGKWKTQAWLLHKDDVYVRKSPKSGYTLSTKDSKTQEILDEIRRNGRIIVVR